MRRNVAIRQNAGGKILDGLEQVTENDGISKDSE